MKQCFVPLDEKTLKMLLALDYCDTVNQRKRENTIYCFPKLCYSEICLHSSKHLWFLLLALEVFNFASSGFLSSIRPIWREQEGFCVVLYQCVIHTEWVREKMMDARVKTYNSNIISEQLHLPLTAGCWCSISAESCWTTLEKSENNVV